MLSVFVSVQTLVVFIMCHGTVLVEICSLGLIFMAVKIVIAVVTSTPVPFPQRS